MIWTGLQRLFMYMWTLCDKYIFRLINQSHHTLLFQTQQHCSYNFLVSVVIARPASQQHRCLWTKTNRICLFFCTAGGKPLLFVCLGVCDRTVWQGVCLHCNHRGLISVWAQVLVTWGATDPPPERSRYENLQMIFLPLSLWYILCWLFKLTSCHL